MSETYQTIQTDQAIEAFRKTEIKRLQLEIAEAMLVALLNGRIDTSRYLKETEKIRAQFEGKRADAQRRGALPR